MRRVGLALAGLAALALAAWGVYAAGPEAVGGPQRVDLGGGPLARLDTVSLERRIVVASATGTVVEHETPRDVLLSDGDGFFSARLEAGHGVPEGATLLVVGRVRQPREGGARRLDARAWSTVERALVPMEASLDSVRLAPDSTRLRDVANRSQKETDRSAMGR